MPANFAVNPYDADALAFERRQNHRLYPTVTFTPDDWRRYRNAYYRLIEAVDKEIGKILDEVDKQGLWENTVVIFTSDHGDGCGAHPTVKLEVQLRHRLPPSLERSGKGGGRRWKPGFGSSGNTK